MVGIGLRRFLRHGSLRTVIQTGLFLAAMLMVLSACGWLIAGTDGAILAAVAPMALLWFGQRLSPHTMMRLQGAAPMDRLRLPVVHAMISDLAGRAGLSRTPPLYWQRNGGVNAFAVGQGGDAAIAVSAGALRHLSPRQLRGVLAHEIAHVAAGDTGMMTWCAAVHWLTRHLALGGLVLCLFIVFTAGEDTVPAWIVWVFFLAPIVVGLLQLGLSRSREFAADLAAVRLTGDPVGLASALARIEEIEAWRWGRVFGATLGELTPKLLRTHPATRERIARLLDAAEEVPQGGRIETEFGPRPVFVPVRTSFPTRRRVRRVRFPLEMHRF